MSWEAFSILGALLSGINTALILQILRHRNGQVAHLTAALLHTVGETKAAVEVAKSAPGAKPVVAPPDGRTRKQQIGMSAR